MKGYRFDDLQNERWVFRSRAYLDERAGGGRHQDRTGLTE